MNKTFVLVPGAGGSAWYWHLVAAELTSHGHEVIAVELPTDDPQAGLAEYADVVLTQIESCSGVVLVGQSMGGFTVPVVATRARVELIVLVNAMVPLPGETPGEWWGHVGSEAARVSAARRRGYSTEFDLATYFLHDLPQPLASAGERYQKAQSDAPFADRCAFSAWPDAPIKYIAGRDDRFFPIELQRRVARERLGIDVDVVAGGHLAALSNPMAICALLESYVESL